MIKKGGLQRKVNTEKIFELESPHRKRMDCCPCTFRFLNLISDNEFDTIVDKYGDVGMYREDIIEFFTKKYEYYTEDYSFTMEKADFQNATKKEVGDTILGLFKYIRKGYGIIGGITRQDNTSHCVLFFRDEKGKPYLLDAQSNDIYTEPDPGNGKNFESFFRNNRVSKLFYLNAYHKTFERPLMLDEEGSSTFFEDAIEGPIAKGGSNKRSKKKKSRRNKRSNKKNRI